MELKRAANCSQEDAAVDPSFHKGIALCDSALLVCVRVRDSALLIRVRDGLGDECDVLCGEPGQLHTRVEIILETFRDG